MRRLYATDGSHYRALPLAVCIPKNNSDIQKLIHFAKQKNTSLIPRTAGTSLAGQVVGEGIVVDVSKYFKGILELNLEEQWVKVQPGIVRDDLNHFLKPHGYFFAPETSTANRAMIGGMIGNNSSGSNSIVYGSTRNHVLALTGFLSDGSEASFQSEKEYPQGRVGLEQKIYDGLYNLLSNPDNQEEIRTNFPKPSIPRRNTGYALDLILNSRIFDSNKPDLNLCQLIAGSEGTLLFVTEAKLKLSPLPPKDKALVCIHCHSIIESMEVNLIALKFQPTAAELIDHFILECTKANKEQLANRFFVEGDPEAILVVEISRENLEAVDLACQELIETLKSQNLGYHFPIIRGEDINKVWALRKAGLGVLGNMPGDAKPAEVVEDTAVSVEDLPNYIEEFQKIMTDMQLKSVYYAHASVGEIHIKPILNMKSAKGQKQYRAVAEASAHLVKKYNGSLSGEHGDGRLRGEFIPLVLGEKNYQLLKQVKTLFDPDNIFNPGKIVNTPPMDTALRHEADHESQKIDTILDFGQSGSLLQMAEQCTGSADCRKTEITGGVMCPSYMATRNEKETTRARANILREILNNTHEKNPLANPEIHEVMDLCLSCKGCKSECPSNVDVAKLKAEVLYQTYKSKPVRFRTRLIANFNKANAWAAIFPQGYNWFIKNPLTSRIFKKIAGFASERSLPKLHNTTLRKWYQRSYTQIQNKKDKGTVYLFCDEFSNYNDVPAGIAAIRLLAYLGYDVQMIKHEESGRTYLSKGLLGEAKKIAEKNIETFSKLITPETPLIGIEPSAILSFRDEYIDLTRGQMQANARELAKNCFTFEEFVGHEIDKGNIQSQQFTEKSELIKYHGHCYQKALSSMTPTKKILSLPKNYQVHLIPSGCCGMAGSFGYEQEHYEVSMKVGELVLFPTVRQQEEKTLIVAAGTSCRHQILDGTNRKALHPAEILWDALIKDY
jgi:FAD/FMN-containing dehydrogenase/Fe-S oxidoreductase